MGKYGGKVTTVYITPTGVRVAEGENKNGSPYVSTFFTIGGVEDYFTEIATDPGVYEITNMTALVDTIITEFNNHNISCKRLMISSSCFGIDTTIRKDKASMSLRDALTGDILGSRKKKDKNVDSKLPPDKTSCKVNWGNLVQDGLNRKVSTESVADKFILKSLVQEFYRKGFEVISISDVIGSLFNFRCTEEATFDSQGKVIFDISSSIYRVALFKDIPVAIDKYSPVPDDELIERIENLIDNSVEIVGRSPKIYLTGEKTRNTKIYNDIIDRLEMNGVKVYDLFDRPMSNPETGLNDETGLPVLTPDYSCNICMFMAPFAKNNVSIVPPVGLSETFRKNSKVISVMVLSVAVIMLGVSGFLAGSRFLLMHNIANNPPRASSLEAQIQSLQSSQLSLQSTVDTLTQADVTVLDLMNFIDSHENEFVTIISVDTMDMLPTDSDTDSAGSMANNSVGEEYVSSGNERAPIVVRGYSRTGPVAVAYFDSMFNSGLPVDPVLNGVEKYKLPNDEEVFIFEIQIGGGI